MDPQAKEVLVWMSRHSYHRVRVIFDVVVLIIFSPRPRTNWVLWGTIYVKLG